MFSRNDCIFLTVSKIIRRDFRVPRNNTARVIPESPRAAFGNGFPGYFYSRWFFFFFFFCQQHFIVFMPSSERPPLNYYYATVGGHTCGILGITI